MMPVSRNRCIFLNVGLGEIATVADIQAGTASKLVDAEGLKKYLPTKVMQVSGFIRIPDVPGGTIIQWGQVTGTINEGIKNVVLPTPFPNSGRFAIAIPLNLEGDTSCDIFAHLQSASLTGINFFFSWVSSSTPANGFQWFAIGY
ncbi:gp53-like domain-containing protein [Escherichia coli]|uniref:gp53-like domain-containing protein n=1 Tax=Escherichia coli TaxID=562 RepID=UPI003C74048A